MKAILTLSLFFAFMFGDPVPGIDISLQQIPGKVVGNGTSDASGRVVFNKVKPGNYTVKLAAKSTGPAGQNARIGESSTGRTGENAQAPAVGCGPCGFGNGDVVQSVGADGTTLIAINFELVSRKPIEPDKPVTLTIGPKGGRITVIVTKATSPAKFEVP